MKEFPLTIITPSGTIYDDRVNSVMAPGLDGLFGVLANHAPLVKILTAGVVRIKQENSESFISIDSGTFEVNGESEVLLLTDTALKAENFEHAKGLLPTFKMGAK